MAAASDLIHGAAMVAVAVNAASAVLETEDKKMDLVGAPIVGLAASLGGGSLRDMLLGRPVFWLADDVACLLRLIPHWTRLKLASSLSAG